MRKTVFLILISAISLLGYDLHGQKVFRDGYIIKKTGESLNGLVEYSMNQDIPHVCTFKRFDIALQVTYTPKDILTFGYRNGNRYESKEADGKIAFYEVLVSGKIILYRKGSDFFLEKERKGLVELKNNPVLASPGEARKEFRNLPEFLTFITEGKAGTISDRFNLKNEIVPLITSYNKESGAGYHVFSRSLTEKELSQHIIETGLNKHKFGIISGVNLYMLKLKYNSDFYALNTQVFLPDPEKEMGLSAGLTYERMLLRKSDRLALRLELLYTRQTFYNHQDRTVQSGNLSRDDAFFDFTGIKIPVMLQYSVTGMRIVPFVNAGVAFEQMIKKNYLHTAEVEDMWHVITTSEDRNMLFNAGEISAVGGAGMRVRLVNNINLHLLGRVEYGSGLFVNEPSGIKGGAIKDPYVQHSIQATFLMGITF